MNRPILIALALLAAGCSLTPDGGDLPAAQAAYDAGEYDRCIAICTSAIEAGSGAPALLLRGRAYERTGEHAKAIADYEKARREEPTRGEAAFRQTRCHLALGQIDQAEATIAWVITQVYGSLGTRDQMLARAVYGEVHLAAGDLARAVSEFEAALKLARSSRALAADGATAIVHYNLSRAHFERGAYRRAREAYHAYLDAMRRGGAEPEGDDLYTLAVLHFLCGEIRPSNEIAAKLPPEYKVRMEAVLSGESFSVRALYEQSQPEKSDDNR